MQASKDCAEGKTPVNPLEYYRNQFGRELLIVMDDQSTPGCNRLSILTLADDPRLNGAMAQQASRFRGLESKTRFLFCYYFSALIDQAIHCRLRELHAAFDHYARYPKFCGILGSYWTNLHPNFLLHMATFYVSSQDEKAATEDFAAYAAFFPSDYYEFLVGKLPQLTNVKPEPGGNKWCDLVLDEVRMAAQFVPTSLPIVQRRGNSELVARWLTKLTEETDRKINDIAQN